MNFSYQEGSLTDEINHLVLNIKVNDLDFIVNKQVDIIKSGSDYLIKCYCLCRFFEPAFKTCLFESEQVSVPYESLNNVLSNLDLSSHDDFECPALEAVILSSFPCYKPLFSS